MDSGNVAQTVETYVNTYAGEIRDRADEDYVTARICYFNDLTENFFWNGQQCIEKYLKSIAIYQNINVKKYGHDLDKLFKKIDRSLAMTSVENLFPNEVPDTASKNETFEEFLKRLTRLGMNRYCSYSWNLYGDEIFKLDAAVYIIRRYAFAIGATIGEDGRPLREGMKRAIDNNNNRVIHGYLGKLIKENGNAKKEHLLRDNFYFPNQRALKAYPTIKSSVHIIDRRYTEASTHESNTTQKRIFLKFTEHLLKNLQFDKETKINIQAMADDIKSRLGLTEEEISFFKKIQLKLKERIKGICKFLKRIGLVD